tara:strand:+ start:246 stop:362 length:117 start_codon:yes stop_codon:yes gene_type:complete
MTKRIYKSADALVEIAVNLQKKKNDERAFKNYIYEIAL